MVFVVVDIVSGTLTQADKRFKTSFGKTKLLLYTHCEINTHVQCLECLL